MHQNLSKQYKSRARDNSHDTHIHIKFTHVPDDEMSVNTTCEPLSGEHKINNIEQIATRICWNK
jgi:hypothetical protein